MRVLITREDAEPLAGLLLQAGLEPVHVPLIGVAPTGVARPAGAPGDVVVTSPNAVRFCPELPELARGARVLAVGSKTAAALRAAGVEPSVEGAGAGAEVVAQARPDVAVWHVGAEEVSSGVDAALQRLPDVVRWPVYRTATPPEADGLGEVLPVDAITFLSGSAVRAFAERAAAGDARVVVFGEPTRRVCEELGLPVHGCPVRPRLEQLVAVVVGLLRERS